MRVTHIDHYNIRLRPSDLEAVRDFYVDAIGLTEGPRPNFSFPGYWLYGGAEAAILHLAATLPESSERISTTKPTGQFDHVSLKATGLASVVSKWSGSRQHLRTARPGFLETLERIEQFPAIAAVYARHWPAKA
jgi:catechol 2,3-dioxygenase-like lactoylglutathione lyase family enzyme